MSTAKHTPGPWSLDFNTANPRLPYLVVASDRYVARVAKEADARLIAAAPELLEALTAALAYNDTCATSDGLGQFSWGKLARAAIAKATA